MTTAMNRHCWALPGVPCGRSPPLRSPPPAAAPALPACLPALPVLPVLGVQTLTQGATRLAAPFICCNSSRHLGLAMGGSVALSLSRSWALRSGNFALPRGFGRDPVGSDVGLVPAHRPPNNPSINLPSVHELL